MEVLRKAGPGVAQMDYHFPARNGISELDVSERFDEVEYMMRQLFETGGKLMLVEALVQTVCGVFAWPEFVTRNLAE
jgi:hypothetical protein